MGGTLGGFWGLYEGLRNPEARTTKLRINSVLNACARRAPFLGNNLSVVGQCPFLSGQKRLRCDCGGQYANFLYFFFFFFFFYLQL